MEKYFTIAPPPRRRLPDLHVAHPQLTTHAVHVFLQLHEFLRRDIELLLLLQLFLELLLSAVEHVAETGVV